MENNLMSIKYNTNVQIAAMKYKYPQFRNIKRGGSITFIGDLQPHPSCSSYKISIEYRMGLYPIVKIISPPIVNNAPHVYEDKSLCLYHPNNFKWRKEKLIANEIIAWSSAWIYFYEIWLDTELWLGPEVPHKTLLKDE